MPPRGSSSSRSHVAASASSTASARPDGAASRGSSPPVSTDVDRLLARAHQAHARRPRPHVEDPRVVALEQALDDHYNP